MQRIVYLLLLGLWPALVFSKSQIEGVRVWPSAEKTRVIFDLSAPARHRIFTLENPYRVVIDLADTRLTNSLPRGDFGGELIRGLRSGQKKGGTLRVVLNLAYAARPESFLLKPYKNYSYRLIIDLTPTGEGRPQSRPHKQTVIVAAARKARDVVIAIDAGHGGEDPGAIGPTGIKEKDITLAIARELARLVDKESGMDSVMIRDGDYYVGLRDRIRKTRQYRADLFISIHANAFTQPGIRGASVFVLSEKGASSEAARYLAQKENESDYIGGVSLDDKGDLLTQVLLDLSQTSTRRESFDVAGKILDGLEEVGRVHKEKVQYAEFAVLKAPDVPSLLVETAFISNPYEERQLNSPYHQQQLARAIMNGIRQYFYSNPLPGTLLAQRRHIISRGDTLSGVAQHYDVSLSQLRLANGLDSDSIKVGDVLLIP